MVLQIAQALPQHYEDAAADIELEPSREMIAGLPSQVGQQGRRRYWYADQAFFGTCLICPHALQRGGLVRTAAGGGGAGRELLAQGTH